jgi:glycine/sarcosine/betaine reductase complex component C subunit beta
VKRAHDVDVSLSAHIIFENLVSKASGVLAFKHLVDKTGLDVNTSIMSLNAPRKPAET